MVNSNILKNIFKPYPIKTEYTMFDWLDERDMTLKQHLEFKRHTECAKSKDNTCANFECNWNYRTLHEIERTGNYEKLKEMVLYHA